jgi:hypothetical protein
MYGRALAGKEKAPGPEHISTLDTVNNLGILYRNQGKLDQAEQMYGRALAGSEKTLGPEHISTLNTVHNLGNLYDDQGKRLGKDDSLSPLNSYVLSQRDGYTSMLNHWCNEEWRESVSGWLVRLMFKADNGNAYHTPHRESLIALIRDVGTAFDGSVVQRKPNLSTGGIVNQTLRAESLQACQGSDGSSCGDKEHLEEDVVNILTEKLYRSLYFKNVGGYTTCVNRQSGKGTASSKTNTTSQPPGLKRANISSKESASDDDQDGKRGKVKKAKRRRPNLDEFANLFACPLCKGNIMFGLERGCRDWKNENIDNVLRVSSVPCRLPLRWMILTFPQSDTLPHTLRSVTFPRTYLTRFKSRSSKGPLHSLEMASQKISG